MGPIKLTKLGVENWGSVLSIVTAGGPIKCTLDKQKKIMQLTCADEGMLMLAWDTSEPNLRKAGYIV
jgi:hypothetical protein